MPHVIVKLWPGKPEDKKQQLADRITEDLMEIFGYGENSISVAIEEIASDEWAEKVYRPEVVGESDKLYKKPGYEM